MSERDNREKYIGWVRENYDSRLVDPANVTRFISAGAPDGATFTLEERAFLYVARGFPVMLNGGTGTGKTTLMENVATRLGVPLYREDGHQKLRLRRALVDPVLVEGRTVMNPGKLTQASIFDGIYFIDEVADVEPEGMVEFHAVFDRRSVDVPTQMGNVALHLGTKDSRFRVAAAGNFAYQRPNFSMATLQRFVWIQMPYLDEAQMARLLVARSTNEAAVRLSGDDVTRMGEKFKGVYESATVTDAHIDALAKMLSRIRSRAEDDKGGIDLDQNPACYLRAQACYSPKLSPKDFETILLETVVYPTAAKDIYMGKGTRAAKFEDIVKTEVAAHRSLFAIPKAAAGGAGIFGLGGPRRAAVLEEDAPGA